MPMPSARPHSRWLPGSALALALTLAPPRTAPAQPATAPQPATTAAAPARDEAVQAVLKNGDVVRLRIYREPELSGEFEVDERGVVSLPKLGPQSVGDQPPSAVRERVMSLYARVLRDPSIEITFLRRVQVLGAVRTPGLYKVAPTATVADVLALAGGATNEGRHDYVELRRNGERLRSHLTERASLAEASVQSGDQLFVPERSWLARNGAIVAAGITAGATLIVALTR